MRRAAIEFDRCFRIFGCPFAQVVGSGEFVGRFDVSVVVDAASEPNDSLLWIGVDTWNLSFIQQYSC